MKCNVQKICGGCTYLNASKNSQAGNKKALVEELVAKNRLKIRVGDPYMADQDTHYRNKVIVGFAKKKGKVYSGLYAPHSHRVVETKGCMMQPEIVNRIIDRITELVQSMKIYLYNEKTGTGVLRHVLIRYAQATDEVLLVFVTGTNMFPSRKNLVNVLTKEFPQIKGILHNVNPRHTSIVMENDSILLYGEDRITDILCDKKISFSSSAFYQVHPQQCEKLYTLAKKMCDLQPGDTVLDTYCGVGSIGLTMADKAKKVMGVELNPNSIYDAKYNAKQNRVRNIEFVNMDSTKFMQEAFHFHHSFDVIILDPPRAGTTKSFIECATQLAPRKILYISCDPKTMVRDLVQFRKCGYVTNKIELVDMFPYTNHIESVCVLQKNEYKEGTKKSFRKRR